MTTPNYSDAERELRRVEEIESAKMQDRTRAIVEAAERLAKAIDAEAMHGDDPPPLVVAARLDLARAIALPEAPPVPESNLRAVYEAAMRFVKEAGTADVHAKKLDVDCNEADAYAVLVRAVSLPPEHEPPRDLIALACDLRSIWRHDADGDLCTVGPNDEIEGILRAWDRAVEKLDAPAWTSTPPTEPGWYFARWGGAPAGVVRVARGYDESDPTLYMWTMGEELCEPLSEVDVVEWWPVPIQPPEDETRSFSAPA